MVTRSDALERVLTGVAEQVEYASGAVAYAINGDGTRLNAAVGVGDPRDGRAMTTDATFRIASSTKTFTAASVLRLAECDELGLDDSVARFLPHSLVERLSVIDGDSHGPKITVRHLLTHSAGLAEMDEDPFLEMLFAEPGKRWTPWEKIDLCIASGPPYFAPGAETKYCDVGYVILAMIIEAVSNRPLAEAFRSLLRFDELGLSAIHLESLEPVPRDAGPRVRHFLDGRDVSDIDPSCDLWGGGGLVSDAHDLAEFWRHLFEGRVFDSPAPLETMKKTRPEEPHGALGMGLMYTETESWKLWRHGGFWGSITLHEEVSGTTVAAYVNQCLDVIPVDVRRSFYSGLVIAAAS